MGINKYYGGKHRYAERIANAIEQIVTGETVYIEPFCGWCSVLLQVKDMGIFEHYEATDANASIVAILHETSRGLFVPPEYLSEEEYDVLKTQQFPSALQAFAGVCYSFNGNWFRGYGPRYNKYAYRNGKVISSDLILRLNKLHSVKFKRAMYQEHADREGCFFYLDPPYKARTEKYRLHTGGNIPFDTDEFWEFARKLSEKNTVIVSEYHAPDDFECILEFPGRCGVEKVFKLKVI